MQLDQEDHNKKILQELARLPQHKRQQNNTPRELVTLGCRTVSQQLLSLGIQFCRIPTRFNHSYQLTARAYSC